MTDKPEVFTVQDSQELQGLTYEIQGTTSEMMDHEAEIHSLKAQVGAAVWWGAQIDAKVKLVEENRRYIQEVVIPSYEISDNWNNPHYNNWLKAGGWKD